MMDMKKVSYFAGYHAKLNVASNPHRSATHCTQSATKLYQPVAAELSDSLIFPGSSIESCSCQTNEFQPAPS